MKKTRIIFPLIFLTVIVSIFTISQNYNNDFKNKAQDKSINVLAISEEKYDILEAADNGDIETLDEKNIIVMNAPGRKNLKIVQRERERELLDGHPDYQYSNKDVPKSVKIAVVLCAAQDSESYNTNQEVVRDMMYDGAESIQSIILNDTRGKIEILRDGNGDGKDDIFGPIVAPYSAQDPTADNYRNTNNDYIRYSDQYLMEQGISLSGFNTVIYVLPRNNWNPGVGGRTSFSGSSPLGNALIIDNDGSQVVKLHEIYHIFHLMHSGIDPDDDGNSNGFYGDRSCCLGGNDGRIKGLNIPKMYELNVLNRGELEDVPTDKGIYNYRLYAKEYDQTSLKALKFERVQPEIKWSNTQYFLSYRGALGVDDNLASNYTTGLSIHRHTGVFTNSYLIDNLETNETHSFLWAPVNVTQTGKAADGSYIDISVEVY